METGTEPQLNLPAYLVMWERRNAAVERQTKAHTAWLYAHAETEAARWEDYRAAMMEAAQLQLACYRMGELLMQARARGEFHSTPRLTDGRGG